MARDSGDVVDHLQSHAGDALQAVIVYDETVHRGVYRRDDVAELHGSDLKAEVLTRIRADTRPGDDDREGALRATVRVFDERVVVHLPKDDRIGTAVVLDPSVAHNPTEFVSNV